MHVYSPSFAGGSTKLTLSPASRSKPVATIYSKCCITCSRASVGNFSARAAPGAASGECSRGVVWIVGTREGRLPQGVRRSAQTLANEVPRCGPEPENPARLRQMALHARKLARTLPGDEAGKRLDAYADELDARARAIERERG